MEALSEATYFIISGNFINLTQNSKNTCLEKITIMCSSILGLNRIAIGYPWVLDTIKESKKIRQTYNFRNTQENLLKFKNWH